MRTWTLALVLALTGLVAGCNIIAYPLYLIAPRAPRKTKKAEFAGLPGKSVAIVIYADMDTQYEYPYCREELSTAISKQLNDHVMDITVIPPREVIRYQEGNVRWASAPMVEVGRTLGVDYVLYVSLSEYSTRERGSASLPLGRVSGSVALWDAAAAPHSSEAKVWEKSNISVRMEANTGLLARDQAALRVLMQIDFADQLAKNFYDHKLPREEE